MFKALNTDKTGKLSLEEFYNIYDVCDLDWKVGGDSSEYNIDKKVLNHRIYNINGSIPRIFCQCPLFWKAKIVKKLFELFFKLLFPPDHISQIETN